MPTPYEISARAVFEAARILVDEPDGLPFRELWSRVLSAYPDLEADWQAASPGGFVGPDRRLRYSSISLVKAGWLRKTGRRWRLTGLGRLAVGEYLRPSAARRRSQRQEPLDVIAFLDATSFLDAAKDRYDYWNEHRSSFESVTELLGALPDTAWIELADLADYRALDARALAAWLQGARPDGWHLVLDRRGEVSRDLGLSQEERDEWRMLLERDGVYDEAASSADRVRARLGLRLSPYEISELPVGEEDPDMLTEPPRRAWLVRGTDQRGASLIRGLWREKGVCSLPAERLPVLPQGAGLAQVRAAVDQAYSAERTSRREDLTAQYHAFLSRMAERDIVVCTDRSQVYLGTVQGAPVFTASEGGRANLQRPVRWHNLDSPHDFYQALPPEMNGPLGDPDADLVELTEFTGDLEALLGEEPDQPPTSPAAPAELPDATQELADRLTMADPGWLQECVELLRDRPQLIFHGPPGTGKTYAALALARHLTSGTPNNTRLVQFHPAYSYEDFFEGFRPRTASSPTAEARDGAAGAGSSGIVFDLVKGPLRRLADAARQRPAEVFVLVIDEINRGNLAKVFGELYFLLEYREEFVHLLYGSDEGRGFRLPPNLVILGTMNTSDRSIALMDAAMRRRFAFLELHPDTEPTASMLRGWLAAHDLPDDSARLLDELNRLIGEGPTGDRDFRIGPSYFMRPAVHARPGAVERVWRTQILPLLAEYHWGDGTDTADLYGLPGLCERLQIDLTVRTAGEDPDDTGAGDDPRSE